MILQLVIRLVGEVFPGQTEKDAFKRAELQRAILDLIAIETLDPSSGNTSRESPAKAGEDTR